MALIARWSRADPVVRTRARLRGRSAAAPLFGASRIWGSCNAWLSLVSGAFVAHGHRGCRNEVELVGEQIALFGSQAAGRGGQGTPDLVLQLFRELEPGRGDDTSTLRRSSGDLPRATRPRPSARSMRLDIVDLSRPRFGHAGSAVAQDAEHPQLGRCQAESRARSPSSSRGARQGRSRTIRLVQEGADIIAVDPQRLHRGREAGCARDLRHRRDLAQ